MPNPFSDRHESYQAAAAIAAPNPPDPPNRRSISRVYHPITAPKITWADSVTAMNSAVTGMPKNFPYGEINSAVSIPVAMATPHHQFPRRGSPINATYITPNVT